MTALFRIVSPGFHTTVQDAGRFGLQHVGVPSTGALDREGLALANALVGNAAGAAGLELMGSGPEIETLAASIRIAAVGGDGALEIAGSSGPPLAFGRSVRLERGQRLRVRLGAGAFCSYLACEGGIATPPVLGSRSTYTRAGFGGLDGRTLRRGDVIPGALDDVPVREELGFAEPRDLRLDAPVRVVLGPQRDHFTDEAISIFLGADWTISAASDRMGFRFDGPKLAHRDGFNIVSDGIVNGSIQVPGSGLPIALLADAQTTGGYPKIATVIAADLPVLARRGPGRTVRFAAVTREEAEAIRRAAQEALRTTIRRFRPVASGPYLDIAALYRDNLIGGVVDAAAP